MSTSARHRGRRLNSAEKQFIAIVLGLAMVHFVIFTVIPVVFSFVLSFTDWQMLGAPRFLGVRNYIELASDPIFAIALKNTFMFAIYYVPPMLALSLGLAIYAN